MTDRTQPEALRLADNIHCGNSACKCSLNLAASELRRQHASIAELEAQLPSSGFSAADMATAESRGFRDGVASVAASAPAPSAHIKEPYTVAEIKAKIASHDYSAELLLQHAMRLLDSAPLAASAGSEPVAWQYQGRDGLWRDFIDARHHKNTVDSGEWPIRALYTHPSPPEGMVGGWQDIATAPKDGSEVLASTAGLGRIVVYWDDDESQWGTGLGYLHRDAPTHWMPLPPQPTTSAGSGKKGE